MTLFSRASDWGRSTARSPEPKPLLSSGHHYFAFLSYSHRDEATAKWLHDALENFRVPKNLVGRMTEHGPVPRRLTPIFRDLHELPASGDLSGEIREAIRHSRFLIVLCSPAAVQSRWINAEIEAFKSERPEACVLAAIIRGEPFASDDPEIADDECLPVALRYRYDRLGRRTAERIEPLAADLRDVGQARRLGFLKLVAGMLGIGLDELVQREALRRQRHLAAVTGGSLVGTLAAVGLAVTAIQARDEARDQRREAESLVGFMVGDLRDRLEPIGRLDVLDSVAARALAYYEKGDTDSLSDDSLVQRSKALTLMGEIANSRGDLERALRFYSLAHRETRAALDRDPDDPKRMFDHAQNVFWVGYIDFQRGNLAAAEAAFKQYDRLARSMVAAEPTNTKWLLERAYATNTLGVLLLEQARYREASAVLREGLQVSEGLAAIAPRDVAFQDRRLEALAWLADAREFSGDLGEALALRERQLQLIESLERQRTEDAEIKRKAMTAHRVRGRLLAALGRPDEALESLRRASARAEEVHRIEPANTEWAQYVAHVLFDQGELQLAAGDRAQAGESARRGCALARRLAERDSAVSTWGLYLPASCLALRADVALAEGNVDSARTFARQAVQLARSQARERPGFAARIAVAEAELLRGEIARRAGDRSAALAAWQAADRAWPEGIELNPHEAAIRFTLLKRLGQDEAAEPLGRRLAAIGYRHPAHLRS